MKSSTYFVAALSIFTFASFLFFFKIGSHSFWGDELQTAELAAHRSQAELWVPTDPAQSEEYFEYGFLAPYYSIIKVWCSVFGSSEAGFRSLSAASSLLALIMILAMGPILWGLGHRASLAAGALFVLSPMMLWYAQEARYYAFLQPLTLLSCWFYLKFWNTRRWPWLAGWSVIAIFSIMTHPFMIFVVVAQSGYGIWFWWKDHFQRGAWVMAGHGMVAGGFLLMLRPLIISHQRVAANEPYNKITDELIPWKTLANFLCGVYEHPSALLAWLLVVTATALLVLHVRDAGEFIGGGEGGKPNEAVCPEKKGDARLWIAASLGGFALMTLVSIHRPIMVEGKKYELIFFAPFCICLGSALMRRPVHESPPLRDEGGSESAFAKEGPSSPRLLAPLFLGVMTLNSIMTDWKYFDEPQKQNWRMAGRMVHENARLGDVWLHQGLWRAFASEYYGGGASRIVKDVVWKPPELKGALPSALQSAKRVWLVKTGGIADAYGARLEEAGFRRIGEKALPSGSFFMTQLWLYEKATP